MSGIISYGAYIPMWRIDRGKIAEAAGSPSAGGERSVASWDEDSLTMAVEAGLDCLRGRDPKEVDGLYFATVSSPFKEKQASPIIASALDLRKDVYTSDVTASTRAGTMAVKAAFDAVKSGSAKKVLVIASDSRPARPRSEFEQVYGDGAAALLVGEDNAIADIEGFSTFSDAIPGPWRREGDTFPRVFEAKLDRGYGLLRDVPEAVSTVLRRCSVETKDVSKFALYAPDPRGYRDIARALKFDAKTQLEDPLFTNVGITGTPHCFLLLISALEKANPDQRIVCAGYGEGADAFLVKVSEGIEGIKGKSKITNYLSSKRMLPSYGKFADFKNLREVGWPEKAKASVVKYWRNERAELPLYGMRCRNCSTLQYPIRRCCIMCGEKDDHDEVKLARRAKVFSYTHDYVLGPGMVPGDGINPATRVIVNLEDGCRILLEMSDHELQEVDVDMPVELTFRLFHQKSDFRFYYWRARPAR